MSEEKDDGIVELTDEQFFDMAEKICSLYVMDHYRSIFEEQLELARSQKDQERKKVMYKAILAEMVLNYHVNESLRLFVEAKEKGLITEGITSNP